MSSCKPDGASGPPPVHPAEPGAWVRWEDRWIAFDRTPVPRPGFVETAAVVFAWRAGAFVLADIRDRGWTTPSGRIEPGEDARAAAIRETWEEIGARVAGVEPIGGFPMILDGGRRQWAWAYVASVSAYGAIPPGSESRGVDLVPPCRIPARYYRFDPVLRAAFETAVRECERRYGLREAL